MAQSDAGFPWHGQSEDKQSQQLSEKTPIPPKSFSETSDHTLNGVNNNEKQRSNSRSTKKRSGSVKVGNATKASLSSQTGQQAFSGPVRHCNVRTIPPWVRDADEDDVIEAMEYLDSPESALIAQHNSFPDTTQRNNKAQRGGHPMSSGEQRDEPTSRWITFARASAYPRETFDGEKVDAEWLDQNFTDYSKKWLENQQGDGTEANSGKYRAFQRKRQVWYKRAQFTILRNPFVPLAFRFTIILFAAVAIALGGSIYHEENKVLTCLGQDPSVRSRVCIGSVGDTRVSYYRDPSALMAVIVDIISIVYTFYITYDEYFSKPLGLRRARAKVRLVLLDLFFIVFQSANLSLVFESLTVDEGACVTGKQPSTSIRFERICDRAQALSGVLTVSLIAWLMTFSISILRLVERINVK